LTKKECHQWEKKRKNSSARKREKEEKNLERAGGKTSQSTTTGTNCGASCPMYDREKRERKPGDRKKRTGHILRLYLKKKVNRRKGREGRQPKAQKKKKTEIAMRPKFSKKAWGEKKGCGRKEKKKTTDKLPNRPCSGRKTMWR